MGIIQGLDPYPDPMHNLNICLYTIMASAVLTGLTLLHQNNTQSSVLEQLHPAMNSWLRTMQAQ